MRDCLGRIADYTRAERSRFDTSRLVQDAVIRNLQTLAESSQRLSNEIKATEPQMPWRELAGFRNVIVHGYLGVDLGAVWLVVEQDLPALSDAVSRMAGQLGPMAETPSTSVSSAWLPKSSTTACAPTPSPLPRSAGSSRRCSLCWAPGCVICVPYQCEFHSEVLGVLNS
jgi:uncharacterized protein with HEPN domain